jgi:hypothetical protein
VFAFGHGWQPGEGVAARCHGFPADGDAYFSYSRRFSGKTFVNFCGAALVWLAFLLSLSATLAAQGFPTVLRQLARIPP